MFPVEPKSNDEEFESPLRGLDRVILTPHIGGSTAEAQANIGLEVAEKLVSTATTAPPCPRSTSPKWPCRRTPASTACCIHANVPGVMSEINKVFADNGINISGQYLQTNAKVGYVVIDVDAEYSDLALEKLQHVNGTIRSRVCSDPRAAASAIRRWKRLRSAHSQM